MGGVSVTELWQWAVAFCAAVVSIAKAVEVFAKASGKKEMSAKINDVRDKLDKDEDRIDKLEKIQEEQTDAQGVMFRSLLAIIEHLRTNNGLDKLKESQTEIQEYLTKR